MPTEIPTTEPLTLRAGDSATWRKSLGDYPAGAGWVLSYTLISAAAKHSFNAAADGDDHLVTLAAATTAAWPAGRYTLIAQATLAPDRYTLSTTDLHVLEDLAAAASFDGRSHARRMLDAIEAALEKRATAEQLDLIELSIFSRTSKRGDGALLEARSKYLIEVRREEAAAGNKPGRGRVYMRF
ncbi:MAG TPA: hypothetical protein PK620_11945 [Denitromonas sp.]|nr:hypothetical protein [Zoogloeaceae bacterium]HQU89420.1 hypothetical protein [Denitromonas sp.]HQV15621.1 hypothetical protein [Denitromonas sp.]